MRKEAFLRFDEATSMVQQYRGSAVDTHYSLESLREIFVNNARREKPRNLALPELERSRPIEAFLGQQRFLRPGEQMFQADGSLPDSSHYLIHPVLSGSSRSSTRATCGSTTA